MSLDDIDFLCIPFWIHIHVLELRVLKKKHNALRIGGKIFVILEIEKFNQADGIMHGYPCMIVEVDVIKPQLACF